MLKRDWKLRKGAAFLAVKVHTLLEHPGNLWDLRLNVLLFSLFVTGAITFMLFAI